MCAADACCLITLKKGFTDESHYSGLPIFTVHKPEAA